MSDPATAVKDPIVGRLRSILSLRDIHWVIGMNRSVALAHIQDGDKETAAKLELASIVLDDIAIRMVGHPGLCLYCGAWLSDIRPCCDPEAAARQCSSRDPGHRNVDGCPSCGK